MKDIQEARVEAWNRAVPEGSAVLLVNDLGKIEETTTRSVAYQTIHGEPVVGVDREYGVVAWSLDQLTPVVGSR